MIVRFIQGSNFWIHEDGSCSYVPRKSEIELIKNSLDAIDAFNRFTILGTPDLHHIKYEREC